MLCDYGCADGGASHDFIAGIIGEIKLYYKTNAQY